MPHRLVNSAITHARLYENPGWYIFRPDVLILNFSVGASVLLIHKPGGSIQFNGG
jgi:hypothetical protein